MIHNVLLIENDPAVAGVIQNALAGPSDSPFIMEWVRRLSDGLERMSGGGIAAVLLDLSLPDSQGINTFSTLSLAAPGVPVLVLGDLGAFLFQEQSVFHHLARDHAMQSPRQ